MKVQIKVKLIGHELKVSKKTEKAYTLLAVMQGADVANFMLDRDCKVDLESLVNKEVALECDYSSKYGNLGSVTRMIQITK